MTDLHKKFEQFINSDYYYEGNNCQPKAPLDRLEELRKKFNDEIYNEIEDLVFAALSNGEKQGFINGYTYCLKER